MLYFSDIFVDSIKINGHIYCCYFKLSFMFGIEAVLFSILPHEQRSSHVYIQRSHNSHLRHFHCLVQQ